MKRFTRIDTAGQPLQRLWRGVQRPLAERRAHARPSRAHLMPEAVDGTLVRLPFDFNPTAKGCGSLSRSGAGRGPALLTRTNGRLACQSGSGHAEHVQGDPVEPVPFVLGHLDVLLHLLQRLARFDPGSNLGSQLLEMLRHAVMSFTVPTGPWRGHELEAGGHLLRSMAVIHSGEFAIFEVHLPIRKPPERMKSTRNSTLSSGNAMKLESLE